MAHHIDSRTVEHIKQDITERVLKQCNSLRLEYDDEYVQSIVRKTVADLSPGEDALHDVVAETGVSHVLTMDDWSYIEFCIYAELNVLQEYLESPRGQGLRFNGNRRVVVAVHPESGLRLHNLEWMG